MSSQPCRPLLVRVATLALATAVLASLVVHASASAGCVRQDSVGQGVEVPENQAAEEEGLDEGYMGTPKSATIRIRPKSQQKKPEASPQGQAR